MPFIPHTQADVDAMLATIGASSIEQLFEEIPADLRAKHLGELSDALTEMEMGQLLQPRAAKDAGHLCFIGAGAYEHHIPAVVWDIASRGEWMTAYTPYQAEASQGTLQLLYEYQTMMASLMGLDVSNASLYDGASALGEAVSMAVRLQRHIKSHRVLIAGTVHPYYRSVTQTLVRHLGIELIEVAYDAETGATPLSEWMPYSGQSISAVVIPQPNFFGTLEEVDAITDWAHAQGALVIGVVNPMAVALLKEPGQWGETGADLACGEGQPLGVPLASGGPYFGFLCCKQDYVRQMPGRIVGQTIDSIGQRGFSLTLQAREQHIRRAKATSNICTNQGLLVTAATIYMSLLGPEGLRRTAAACHANAKALLEQLIGIPGVQCVFSRPFFHEFVLRLNQPVASVLKQLALRGIQGGYDLGNDYPALKGCLLVCVTETKTVESLAHYREELIAALQAASTPKEIEHDHI